jgi:hypothetical protein
MDMVVMLTPWIFLLVLCFVAGLLLRFVFFRKQKVQLHNVWWQGYAKKIMAIWLRIFAISLVAGILLLWLDGFIKIPKTNFLFIVLQILTTILFGIVVTVIQCDFIGLGFLLIPFRDKTPIDNEIQRQFTAKTSQFAIWFLLAVLLLSFLVDWGTQFFFKTF